MSRLLRNNGLSLVMFALFFLFLGGQSLAGWMHYNETQQEHGEEAVGWGQYVVTGEFIESVFENWESEFLQMAAFILLSALLVQRGAAESKKPEEADSENSEITPRPDSPGPVKRGGLWLKMYSHSLSLTLFALFVFSFAMHAIGGHSAHNEAAHAHGRPSLSLLQFLGSATFWFQSFQNWQSEFLSVGALIVLSIWLREKGSPESKPVQAPHRQTGS